MSLDTISNYYERFVDNTIRDLLDPDTENDPDFIADVACVALNTLPPRYIRHHVDMAFYMTAEERSRIQKDVTMAVQDGIAFVRSHARQKLQEA